jgi:hypothetical protein
MENLMADITIDGKGYDFSELSEFGKETMNSIRFLDEQILQKTNELQISETAKLGYMNALRSELKELS